ncbi:hypothetical protein ACM9HB_35825, partial [Streptomyces sp. JAC128]|uniref:hypothetical protein n=1 Tax=Streptomyces sp. JAC128 TaxID=3418412 RepID=UPI003D813E5E
MPRSERLAPLSAPQRRRPERRHPGAGRQQTLQHPDPSFELLRTASRVRRTPAPVLGLLLPVQP